MDFKLCCGLLIGIITCCRASFLIGRGIGDVTGLLSEGVLYGYGRDDQDARGLHTRQFARTFIFVDTDTSKRVCIVVAEITMTTQSLRDQVLDELKVLYGDLYTEKNVMITASHSHAVPGGANTYWIYTKPTGGFIRQTFDLYVKGIVQSIKRAHRDLAPGELFYNSGDLLDASINRSPYAYEQNPREERAKYANDVDKEMHVLKMTRGNVDLGMLNLFPVHATSMKNTNHLISSDNKGYASQMFERVLNPNALPGKGEVLGAFAQSCEGDVSPNIQGDYCTSGNRCDYQTSTCPEDRTDPTLCNSKGPTGEMFEDTRIIGERQFRKALELYRTASEEINGSVDFRHQWVDMSNISVAEGKTTCKPAMGYSFAAGATDGPGVKPFTQAGKLGDGIGGAILEGLIGFFLSGSNELHLCHAPKPIAIASGEINIPYQWQPDIVPIQLFQIGTIYIIGIPAEVTTMAGRRMMNAVKQTLNANGVHGIRVFVMALSNGYTGYVTTEQEYSVQRYEGAATLYGPHTQAAYQILLSNLARAMALGEDTDDGPLPPDLRGLPGDALGALRKDKTPKSGWFSYHNYGDVLLDSRPSYKKGETVNVTFVGGNPRAAAEAGQNKIKFAQVQKYVHDKWATIYDEASWETRFYWNSNCHDLSLFERLFHFCNTQQSSTVSIHWAIPIDQSTGIYRILHSGYAKDVDEKLIFYSGNSRQFSIVV